MATIYACTHIEKTVEVDHFVDGCDSRPRCIINESCDVTAETFPELIEKIGEKYVLDIDDLFIPEGDGQEFVEWFGFNRLETGDSDVPDEHEMSQWRKGELTLYLADYTFHVEKRTVSAISVEEIKASLAETGVKIHA